MYLTIFLPYAFVGRRKGGARRVWRRRFYQKQCHHINILVAWQPIKLLLMVSSSAIRWRMLLKIVQHIHSHLLSNQCLNSFSSRWECLRICTHLRCKVVWLKWDKWEWLIWARRILMVMIMKITRRVKATKKHIVDMDLSNESNSSSSDEEK